MKRIIFLIKKEIKDIFTSKSSLLFLIILSFLTGYSFYSAVVIYSKASVSAINNPLYATGFEPVQGVFLPAFGGIFVLFSLFLPFIIIPLLLNERERNTITILLQIPFSFNEIIASKFFASTIFIVFSFLIMNLTIILWRYFGGHIPVNELFLLNSGYFLYGIFVVGISLFSATIFKNNGSASIFTIFIITLSWLIDFGKDMNISNLINIFSDWSVTSILKYFENGIFSIDAIIYFATIILIPVFLTRAFIDIRMNKKYIFISLAILVSGVTAINLVDYNSDITESRRNSFSPEINKLLKKIHSIEIDIYLRRTDSRYKDYENSFLKKLKLVKNNVKVEFIKGKKLDKDYGKFVYKINNKTGSTYSNSEEEIFPLIFKLAGVKYKQELSKNNYPGYPLVVSKSKTFIISSLYYLLIPIILISLRILLKNKNDYYN